MMSKRRIFFILVDDDNPLGTRWYVESISDGKIKWTCFKDKAAIYEDRNIALDCLIPALDSIKNVLHKYTVVLA